jgi:hypothetical protein
MYEPRLKGVTLLSRGVLSTGTRGSFVTSSTQSDVLCRWDGEEAMREAGGHEFESLQPRTRIFRVKIAWLVTLACVRASRGFSKKIDFFDAGVHPPLVPVGITNRD